jgi:hypothetical protein
MGKVKDTPNLPGSSRLQAPSGGGGSVNGLIKETGGMSGSGKGTSKRVLTAASGTGLKKKNPYC